MIRIRAFRAVDDESACRQYIDEHMQILKIFGITKITTATDDWMYNPNVYVIMADDTDTGEALGGARIQIYDEEHPLPIVTAIEKFDRKVIEQVQERAANGGTAEICGLWNSRKVAGLGIGTLYLSRAGIAMAAQLPITSMYVLCGEHTIGITMEKGFVIEEGLGKKGTFYYPKEGLIATAAIMNDIENLSDAKEIDRALIMSLRAAPKQSRIEDGPKGELPIKYSLEL